jgi:DNA-binding NarL/FixJ family response regulator
MIRITVYSNQPILARGLQSVIASDPDLELVAVCSSLSALKEHLANETPDIAVLDLTAEITSGEISALHSLAPESKLILWTDTIAIDFALQALAIGVRGVLRKMLPLEAHLQCLQRVYAGELWFEKSLTDDIRNARRVSLTRRESQLVSSVARGMKNKEIAYELGLTEGTVKVYLSHLFQKSGARDRYELALRALRTLGAAAPVGDQGELHYLAMEPASCL